MRLKVSAYFLCIAKQLLSEVAFHKLLKINGLNLSCLNLFHDFVVWQQLLDQFPLADEASKFLITINQIWLWFWIIEG